MCNSDREADEMVFVCRCEEITREEILAAIQDGATTITGIKARTHACMGLCQGRTCGRIISQMIAKECGKHPAEIKPRTSRSPVRTATISEFLKGEDDA